MEPKLKRRRNVQDEESDAPDRLSALPDFIVNHILSFLDTKTTIATSALSKRYRLLWTQSRRLDFELPTSPLECCGDLSPLAPLRRSRVRSFKSYVSRVLELREPSNLTSFRLSMRGEGTTEGFLERCVGYAARHEVQHLKLSIGVDGWALLLPAMLLTSSSLVSLNLHNVIRDSIELPKSVSLPNLKELSLKKFKFCSKNFTGGIFSGCPNLEKLVLSKCCIEPDNGLKILDLNCPNLSRLEIKCWRSPWRCFDEQGIKVKAPKLASFTLQGHIARVNFSPGNLCSLNECSLQLAYPSACITEDGIERKIKTAESCIHLLRQIRSAKYISISLKAVEIISTLPDSQLHADFIFENLECLMITAGGEKLKGNVRIDEAHMRRKAVISGFISSDTNKDGKISPQSLRIEPQDEPAEPVTVPIPKMVLELFSSPFEKLLMVKVPKGLLSEWKSRDRLN